ncbi:MAG: hypothetical protein KGL39_02660 [Patescibacteria group bacterium]|nr:hypothetical protein [Patescibacteria group bacterium]
MSKKTIIRTYQFRSSKDAGVFYSTILYSDGSVSCNCRAFTERVNQDGTRNCKHVAAAGLSPMKVTQHGQPLVVVQKKLVIKHGVAAKPSGRVARKFGFDED